MNFFKGLIFTLIIALMASCLDDIPTDFDNPESNWNPNFSFPAGYGTLAMDETSGFDTSLFLIDTLTGYPLWVEEVDIPMNFSMPFNMEGLNEYSEKLVRIMFRLNTANGFPAEAIGQIYFQDGNFVIIDSLFTDGALTLDPGAVEGNGEKVNPAIDQNDIYINADKINDLVATRNILILGSINNLKIDTSLIDYYPDYTLDLQLGVQVELKLDLTN